MRADSAQYRLDDPGVGLRGNGRRVLTYADLFNLKDTPDPREPEREVVLHLTGNMSRYMWSMNGIKFADADPAQRGVDSGLSDVEAGLRLRYEIRREFAPYIGVNWTKKFGNTADFAEEEDEETEDTQFVAGIRAWY